MTTSTSPAPTAIVGTAPSRQDSKPAPAADEEFALVLARFACGLTLDDLPAPVIAAAKANVLDTLACAVAGSSSRGVSDARALALE